MKGTYTIVIRCRQSVDLSFGNLGRAKIRPGLYVYSGSALGRGAVSLEGRIRRHLRRRKKIRWHVDYVTSSRRCMVKAAIYLESTRRLECDVSRMIGERLGAHPLLPHIGASDCSCSGHLMRVTSLREKGLLDEIWAMYAGFGNPVCLKILRGARWVSLHPTS